jgi:hypothetical protein
MQIVAKPYSVRAVNVAHASENKIHDDTVARRLGFNGGLVPGVDVYAYATHAAVTRWGRAWLEHGAMEVMLKRPVYEGKMADVTSQEDVDGSLQITVQSEGGLSATASAWLPTTAEAPPDLMDFPAVVPPENRPPATAETMPTGLLMGSRPFTITPELATQYLRDIGERETLYAEAGVVHPGTILRVCNWALAHSVRMGAWIHAGSKVRNFATARVGAELTGRARVLATYERKGHRFVDLDVLVVADGTMPIARVIHTAIYLPRQLAEDHV